MNEIISEIEKGTTIIAGPCSVESYQQIDEIANKLSQLGIKFLRGGAFKPRTSPNSFQGLGELGIHFLREAANKYNMYVVSELLDSYQVDKYHNIVDVIQIGSRNMSSYQLLKHIGKVTSRTGKPVLLKRGFSATITELIYAAEYIINEGNPNVILCLRGIRTFEQMDSMMRFTPDLAAILELKERCKLKIFFDPSHSTGKTQYVIQISKAALLLGASGLLIECHNSPDKALSDGRQSILPEQLNEILI